MKIGKNNAYILGDRALAHIVKGDFNTRPVTVAGGRRSAVNVISGGLHTWEGWVRFLEQHQGFVHLADYDTDWHKGWYFARELQNGVIVLKIPRELFSGGAADMTMRPDVLLKSGYLWKTLFPIGTSEEGVVAIIREALGNVAEEESSIGAHESIIIGYARLSDPLTALRVRIQLTGNEIRSAFPTWDQPATGNNGKPYSPEQSIMFPVAASTIGATGQSIRNSRLFKRSGAFEISELVRMTPPFLFGRSFPTYGVINDEWRTLREEEVKATSLAASHEEVRQVVAYLRDFCVSKEPFRLQMAVSMKDRGVHLYAQFANLAMVIQNVADCFVFLLHADNKECKRDFIDCAVRHLQMSVLHAGALNLFEAKRLIKLILRYASAHHAKDAVMCVVEALSRSPIRGALYSEVNIHPFFKTNDANGYSVIALEGRKVPIVTELLYDWAATNLGENYLTFLSREQRFKIAKTYVTQNASEEFVQSSLRYFVASDFEFFANWLEKLPSLFAERVPPSEACLIEVIREYDRLLLTYRQRIVLEDPEAYAAEVDYSLAGTPEFFAEIKQKHKRAYVVINHEAMLKAMVGFAASVGYAKLQMRVKHLLSKIGKEGVPLPLAVPERFRKWESKNATKAEIDAFVENPLVVNGADASV